MRLIHFAPEQSDWLEKYFKAKKVIALMLKH
jgi:hypothetical protein